MTAGELRKSLIGVPDDLEVVVRALQESDEGDCSIVAGIETVGIEEGCDGKSAFMIDAFDEPEGDENEMPRLRLVVEEKPN